jgi:hypothetical protein
MRNVALSIVLSSLLCVIGIMTVQPVAAGEYYDGDGYYGGHSHSYYRSELNDRPYYGPGYVNRSNYYEPQRHYYRPYADSYDDACSARVKIYDNYGGWVWGHRLGCW